MREHKITLGLEEQVADLKESLDRKEHYMQQKERKWVQIEDIMDEYAKECADLNRVPRVGGVKDQSRSYAGADGREGRNNHAEVRLSVERALQLCAVDAAVRDAVDASF